MFRSFLAACLAVTCLGGPAHAAPDAKIAWTVKLDQPVYTEPQASGGSVFLTSMQPGGPNVFAVDGATGKLLWSYATQGAVAIPPTIGAAQVFVASDIGSTHYLRALNAKTGLLIWQYTRSQPPECMCSQASILSGNMLFAQSDGHSLYAFAPSGAAPSKRLWQFPGNGAPLTAPVVADGLVVFGSGDHDIYALDAKSGAIRWTAACSYVFAATPLVTDGVVIIGDQGGNIDGFALATGKMLWSTAANAAIDNAAVAAGGTAFLTSEDHSVYALNLRTGQPVWQYAMDDYSEYAPVLAAGLAIAANRAGELVALDASSGKRAWQTSLNGVPFSQPVFWPQANAIVFKIGDHMVAAFAARTGALLWQYSSPAVLTPPVPNGGHIEIATSAGQVIALD